MTGNHNESIAAGPCKDSEESMQHMLPMKLYAMMITTNDRETIAKVFAWASHQY